MSIKDVAQEPKPRRVMGADCSTQSFAFSIFEDGELVKWGEVQFVGRTVFHRLADGQAKIRALKEDLKVDVVVIESAIYVQNKKTVILLAYAFGGIISALVHNGAEVVDINPLLWQRYIGNPPLTKAEKDAIVKENPGRSKSWYQNKNRETRKAKTAAWAKKKFGLDIESDNITDAIGLGWYGTKELI